MSVRVYDQRRQFASRFPFGLALKLLGLPARSPGLFEAHLFRRLSWSHQCDGSRAVGSTSAAIARSFGNSPRSRWASALQRRIVEGRCAAQSRLGLDSSGSVAFGCKAGERASQSMTVWAKVTSCRALVREGPMNGLRWLVVGLAKNLEQKRRCKAFQNSRFQTRC
jgi:hypothetical protein